MTYATYGSHFYPYGTTDRYYGESPSPSTNWLWSILIDWDNDGSHNGVNEAAYCSGLEIDRGFDSIYQISGDGFADHFAPPMVGRATLTLDNSTGRYNLYDSSGFPSTDIAPGRLVNIYVREGYASTDNALFAGLVKDITVNNVNKTATVTCVDGVAVLQEAETRLSSSDITAEPMGHILTDIGWNWGTDVDIDYYSDAPGGVRNYFSNGKAYGELYELQKRYASVFFTRGDGTFEWASIQGIPSTNASSTDPMQSSDGIYIDGSILLKTVEISQPWENVFTKFRRRYIEGTAQSQAIIWSQGSEQVTVDAGETINLVCNYSYSASQGKSFYAIADTPMPSTNYTANSASDGSGTNLTSLITITLSDYGTTGEMEIVNSSTYLAYFTSLQISGTPYETQARETSYTLANYYNSNYEKVFLVNMPYTPVSQFPQFANYYGGMAYPHSTRTVTVSLENRIEQFANDINRLIHFTNVPGLALQAYGYYESGVYIWYYNEFRIMRIRHKWLNASGQSTRTTWNLRHVVHDQSSSELGAPA